MLKSAIRTALAAAILALPIHSAAADDAKIIESIPSDLWEVVSGGAWSDAGKGGSYRAIVLSAGKAAPSVRVYLQWVAFEEGSTVPTVVQTVPFKEVNDEKLQIAFITMGGEKENEIYVTVDSYDAIDDRDISLTARATAPGQYTLVKELPKSLQPPGDDDLGGDDGAENGD